ncbi:hypothetical protein ACMBCM_06850, partial [Spiroplasma sp. K1]
MLNFLTYNYYCTSSTFILYIYTYIHIYIYIYTCVELCKNIYLFYFILLIIWKKNKNIKKIYLYIYT